MARVAPWLVALLAFAVAVAALVYAQSRDEAAHEADRAAESAQLTADGYVVASRVEADMARADAAQALVSLSAAQDRVRALEKRGARVVSVARLASEPLSVEATDLVAPGEPPPCLVAPSDKLQLRMSEVRLVTAAENTVLVAVGEAWRLRPDAPDFLLARGELTGGLEVVPPPLDTRWPWWAWATIGAVVGTAATVATGYGMARLIP